MSKQCPSSGGIQHHTTCTPTSDTNAAISVHAAPAAPARPAPFVGVAVSACVTTTVDEKLGTVGVGVFAWLDPPDDGGAVSVEPEAFVLSDAGEPDEDDDEDEDDDDELLLEDDGDAVAEVDPGDAVPLGDALDGALVLSEAGLLLLLLELSELVEAEELLELELAELDEEVDSEDEDEDEEAGDEVGVEELVLAGLVVSCAKTPQPRAVVPPGAPTWAVRLR